MKNQPVIPSAARNLRRVAVGATSLLASAQFSPSLYAQQAPPRTSDGHPDFQGNWTNATLTPIERPKGVGKVLTKEQVAALEKVRTDTIQNLAKKSDPNRTAPPVGGDGSTGAAGNVGGYNYFWIDAGDHIAMVNGEPRSSLIVNPPDGRIPALTPAALKWVGGWLAERRKFNEYDNPENRPLGERCMLSFGSNAGPPMLPNYFYNNNYTIVQSKDHILIMTEMVHDARIIYMSPVVPLPKQVRPWMGDSHGRWEGDTLVIETTNIHPTQVLAQFVFLQSAAAPTEHLKVIERLHRIDDRTLLYRFTVDDPTSYAKPWSGEVPMLRMDEQIYEYACHEGNYALANVLSGARAKEREQAAKAKPKTQEKR